MCCLVLYSSSSTCDVLISCANLNLMLFLFESLDLPHTPLLTFTQSNHLHLYVFVHKCLKVKQFNQQFSAHNILRGIF